MGLYSLSSNALIRREFFGCSVCNTLTGEFYTCGSEIFDLMVLLQQPISFDDLLSRLSETYEISADDLQYNLDLYTQIGVVTMSDEKQSPLTFFFDRDDFRQDCLAAPIACTIYITDLCPKECLHCVVKSAPWVDTTGELSVEEWCRVLDGLRAAGVARLVITGGDPLVKQGIFEILEYAARLKFSIFLLTDKDRLSQKQLDRIMAIPRISYIQMSLDGATAETHDFMRGKGAFEQAVKRMQLFQRNGIGFTISSTIHKENLSQVEALGQIARRYGAAQLYLNPLAPYGRGVNLQHLLLDDRELWLLAQKYLQLVAQGIDSGNGFWNMNIDRIGDPNFHPFKDALHAVSLGIYTMSISSKGFCHLDSKLKAIDRLGLGNVRQRSILEMWEDPMLDSLRAHYRPEAFAFVHEKLTLGI